MMIMNKHENHTRRKKGEIRKEILLCMLRFSHPSTLEAFKTSGNSMIFHATFQECFQLHSEKSFGYLRLENLRKMIEKPKRQVTPQSEKKVVP